MTDEAKKADEPKLPAAVQLQNDVKKEINTLDKPGSVTSARQRVIDDLAQQELDRRVSVLATALGKRKELSIQVKKVKPDQVFYDAEGNKTSESFTKAKADELKKLKNKLEKLDGLINTVIEAPSAEAYQKLGDFKA